MKEELFNEEIAENLLKVNENGALFFNNGESKKVLFNETADGVFKDEDDTLVVDINKLASNIREKTNRSLDEEYRNMVLELYSSAKKAQLKQSRAISWFNLLKKYLGLSYSQEFYYNRKELMNQAIEEANEIIELKKQ